MAINCAVQRLKRLSSTPLRLRQAVLRSSVITSSILPALPHRCYGLRNAYFLPSRGRRGTVGDGLRQASASRIDDL